LSPTGVIDTGGKFATGNNNTSDTGGIAAGVIAAGVIDTGGKFATGVVDTGGAPLLANISAHFRKIRNGLNGILWGWGETDP
jgi:hypothetical protein